jgi:hypothetical protein
MAKKQKSPSKREKRKIRTQQIIFGIIAVIIILSWVISLIAR